MIELEGMRELRQNDLVTRGSSVRRGEVSPVADASATSERDHWNVPSFFNSTSCFLGVSRTS
jgi:hypothetical protein